MSSEYFIVAFQNSYTTECTNIFYFHTDPVGEKIKSYKAKSWPKDEIKIALTYTYTKKL